MENALPDLEAVLAELDEEQAQAIREAMAAKDATAKRATRDLQLATDDGLKERFPRAWRAYQKKRLDLGDATGDDLIALMRAKEEELADLGVPAGDAAPAVAPAPEPEEDPAAAFGTPVGGGQPTGAKNHVQDFLQSMKADTPQDRDNMATILGELNATGHKQQIEELVDLLNARPILSRNVI